LANNSNQFFRTKANNVTFHQELLEKHRIWLNLTNDLGFFSQMMVGYIANATLEFDDLIDGKAINDSPKFLSSLINNQEYTIQGRPLPFNNQDIIFLKFKTQTAGNYRVSIGDLDDLFQGNQQIYLKDNLLNVVHNLKNSAYNISIEIGEFSSRFELIYQDSLLQTSQFDSANQVVIFTVNDLIKIKSNNQLINEINVFDILGRKLNYNSSIDKNEFILSSLHKR
jgi:hypothetical protein